MRFGNCISKNNRELSYFPRTRNNLLFCLSCFDLIFFGGESGQRNEENLKLRGKVTLRKQKAGGKAIGFPCVAKRIYKNREV